MAEAGATAAGAGQGPEGAQAPGVAGGGPPRAGPDWAGLPEHVLMKVATKHVAQTEAGWAARLKVWGNSARRIQAMMEERKHDGNCLFVFARVCRGWRKAQLKVGGPLRTRVCSDVILPGRAALAKWALAEGCPRDGVAGVWEGDGVANNMAHVAAEYGHKELVQWLCGEGGFAMDRFTNFSSRSLMHGAARSGKLELVQWLWGKGCPWDWKTCFWAVGYGHVEVLRWLRENGCPWDAATRDRAAWKLRYTDDFGNLV